MPSIENVDTSSDDSGGEEIVPGFGEGSISSEFGASGEAGEGGAGPRVYAWENVGEECEEIAALKRELEEQVGCPHSPFPASPVTNALTLARRRFPTRTIRNGPRGLDPRAR